MSKANRKSYAEKQRDMALRPDTDPYEVLGVARDADDATIKSAYREKAILYHPDKHPDDPTTEEKFKEVVEAFDVLSDLEKRDLFDKYGNVGPEPSPRAKRRAKERSRWKEWRKPGDEYPSFFDGKEDYIYIGIVQGLPHYHHGVMKVCIMCGFGINLAKSTVTLTGDSGQGSGTLPGGAYKFRSGGRR